MKISNIILASLFAASLTGIAQDEKPIGCGKKPAKEVCAAKKESEKSPAKITTVKKDSLQKTPVKRHPDQCMKCGRG